MCNPIIWTALDEIFKIADTIECNNIGIKYLTVYAFSTENWARPEEEKSYLFKKKNWWKKRSRRV